jgi:hypothetical protein
MSFVLVACGLGDSGFEELRDDDVLAIANTTTTTTTTTTSTTIPVVTSSLPGATTTTIIATTTTPVQTQPIEFYWVVDSRLVDDARLQKQTIPLSEPTVELLIFRLEQGPPVGEASVGLDTKVRDGLVLDVDVVRGIATVDLNGEVVDAMFPGDPPLAIAQIVLTLTRFQGVGQVLFTRDGLSFGPPLPPNDVLAEDGQPVAFEDFETLLAGGPVTTSTTTTTEAPPATGTPPDTEPGGTQP